AQTVNAVETMFRKLKDAGLVAVEDTSPRKFSLTDKGRAEVGNLEDAASDASESQAQELGWLRQITASLFRPLIHSEVCREVAELKKQSDSQPPAPTNIERVKSLREKTARLLAEETETA